MSKRFRCLAPAVVVSLAGTAFGQVGELTPAEYASAYAGDVVVEAEIRTAKQLQAIGVLDIDVWTHGIGIGTLDMRVSPEERAALDALGITYTVTNPDLEASVRAEREDIMARRLQRGGTWYDNYQTYSDFMQRIQDLVAQHPGLATTEVIGQTLQGRDIRAIRISGSGDWDSKPVVFLNGCQHAREWVSPATTMYIAEQLLEQYNTNADVKQVVDLIDFHIVPIVNADGYVYSWTNQRLWRKNRRGGYGVDLNRNWSTGWGGDGSSGSTSSETYRGSSPFSEPETQVLRDYFLSTGRVAANIDIHSYSQLVLRPWGYIFGEPPEPDRSTLTALGDGMAQAIFDTHGATYISQPAWALYIASGTMDDWGYDATGSLSYTTELRPVSSNPGFQLPANQIRPTAEENFNAILFMSQFVGLPLRLDNVGAPSVFAPGEPNFISIDVEDGQSTFQNGTLYSRVGSSGPFTAAPLTSIGGDTYQGQTLSAPCGETIEYYFEVQPASGDSLTYPSDAPTSVLSGDVLEEFYSFEENFQSTNGWTVSNQSLSDGAWSRGVPAGDGDRGDPTSDFDGSGACWLTDNVAGNSDVDGGPTRLLSPAYDLDGLEDVVISYARWFYNDDNDGDRLDVHVSDNNGASWTLVESVGGNTGWVEHSFALADYVNATSQVRLRFSATDNPNDSVTEAAIDGLRIASYGCDDSCPADWNGDTTLNTGDFLDYLNDYNAVLGGGSPTFGDPDIAAPFGTLNTADFLAYLNLYGDGCP